MLNTFVFIDTWFITQDIKRLIYLPRFAPLICKCGICSFKTVNSSIDSKSGSKNSLSWHQNIFNFGSWISFWNFTGYLPPPTSNFSRVPDRCWIIMSIPSSLMSDSCKESSLSIGDHYVLQVLELNQLTWELLGD